MRNYLTILALFLVTITQAQIMLPAYQAIQYRRNTLPTIITTSATSLTSNSAVSGGTITNDGGTPITLRGVCWSTTPLPTTALATKTTDGTGIGNYTSTMIGLTIGTTYYIRAYATNNVGTAYGNEISFTKDSAPNVLICNQIWADKNLDVITYSDGTPIPQVTDPTAWANLTTGAWCYYNNDSANGAIYGKLYNGYAVLGIYNTASLNNPALRKNLAPVGWHIPTEDEYVTLAVYCLGGENVAGGKMKETGITHWLSPNANATNSSGFTALPGGWRNDIGGYMFIGKFAFFRCSTSSSLYPDTLIYFGPRNDSAALNASYTIHAFGMSIRCIKD